MAKVINEIGKQYSKLKVIASAGKRKNGHALWLCECVCGSLVKVDGSALRSGKTTRCLPCSKGVGNLRHGLRNHPIYTVYYEARTRCTNSNRPEWHNYGGRGIQFRFKSIEEFANHLLPTWFSGATLDRIDVNGHYESGNVRWATKLEQGTNMRKNVWIEYKGEKLIMSAWARKIGVSARAFQLRLRKYGIEKAITTPVQKRSKR